MLPAQTEEADLRGRADLQAMVRLACALTSADFACCYVATVPPGIAVVLRDGKARHARFFQRFSQLVLQLGREALRARSTVRAPLFTYGRSLIVPVIDHQGGCCGALGVASAYPRAWSALDLQRQQGIARLPSARPSIDDVSA